LIKPQGTYLAWLDFREINLDEKTLDHLITHKANLWLHKGSTFGQSGTGFMRINVATRRAVIEKAMHNLSETFKNF